ncbi:MAG: hypothetical protein R3D27_11360 [Hyphomicrobiaceae bacterium]
MAAVLAGIAAAAGGCTHEGFGSVDNHYSVFSVNAPKGNAVEVCHAYGCKMRTRVKFSPADIAEIAKLMKTTRKADTPAEERRAVAYAVGWLERRVGKEIGTDKDRAGMDFTASGDPTQQDCVDEATNTTSYLTFLKGQGFIKHHDVGVPFAKENYLNGVSGWTHWTAVLKEHGSGQRWAVDSWIYANGENPAVVEAEKWYISDLSSLPKPTR